MKLVSDSNKVTMEMYIECAKEATEKAFSECGNDYGDIIKFASTELNIMANEFFIKYVDSLTIIGDYDKNTLITLLYKDLLYKLTNDKIICWDVFHKDNYDSDEDFMEEIEFEENTGVYMCKLANNNYIGLDWVTKDIFNGDVLISLTSNKIMIDMNTEN